MSARAGSGIRAGIRCWVIVILLLVPVHAHAQTATDGPAGGWRSLEKALTYQSIVVTTDQLLYWTIMAGAAASDTGFLIANAVSGVAYYVAFDRVWTSLSLDPPPGGTEVSVTKAVAYRVFDTARAFAVTLAVGTPLAASVEIAAAIAVTRTAIYMLHDGLWSHFAPAAATPASPG